MAKTASQLFTFAELVKNNKPIFSKLYPRTNREPDSHYICKVYLGENLKKYYPDLIISYEYPLEPMMTNYGMRQYIADIFAENIDDKNKVIRIFMIEINGGVHFKNKKQIAKTNLKKDTIKNYYKSYSDKRFTDYDVFFEYISFEPDDFLYNDLDYFLNIFKSSIHRQPDQY